MSFDYRKACERMLRLYAKRQGLRAVKSYSGLWRFVDAENKVVSPPALTFAEADEFLEQRKK